MTAGTCIDLITLTEVLPPSVPPGVLTGRFPILRYQYAEAFAKTAGVVLDWFNREFAPGMSLCSLDEMASQVPIGSHGLIMLPHFDGMNAPGHPGARGAFLNLSLHHNRADMYRSTLEALGFTLRQNLELLRSSGFGVNTVRAIGGAAKSDFWLQMVVDIIGFLTERPQTTEAAVLGAAMIAAYGSGVLSSLEAGSEAFYQRERLFTPDEEAHGLYEICYRNYARVCRHVYSFGN